MTKTRWAISNHKSVSTWVLCFALCMSVQCQRALGQYRFEQTTVRDGLSQNTVNDIFEDDLGYLWLATQDGLNRFDGYEYKKYLRDKSDTTGIADAFVWGIDQDKLGRIWFCSRFNVSVLNTRTNRIAKFSTDFYETGILDLLVDGDTTWILGHNKLFKIPIARAKEGESFELTDFEHMDLPGPSSIQAFSLARHKKLGLVIHTHEGLLFFNDGSFTRLEADFGTEDHLGFDDRMIISQSGDIWLASPKGLHKFDVDKGTIEMPFKELRDIHCYALGFDSNENLWVSTSLGLKIISEGKVTTPDYRVDYQSEPMTDIYYEIHRSKNGTMRLGSSNKGLYTYNPAKDCFKFLDDTHGLGKAPVWSMAKVDSDIYWIGTNSGLYELKISSGKSLTSERFLIDALDYVRPIHTNYVGNKRITHIYLDKEGRKWVGIQGEGLYVFDRGTRMIQKLVFGDGSQLANEVTSVNYFDGAYWVTTFSGIYTVARDLSKTTEFEHQAIETRYFFTTYSDQEKELWIGSNRGVYKYLPEQEKIIHHDYIPGKNGPSYFFANNIVEDRDKIWIGTFGGGVDVFDETSNEFRNFGNAQGLTNQIVSGLQIDGSGNPWISTNRGISKLELKDSLFWNFDERHGVLFNEASINASFKTEDGTMLFGTAGGLVVFHPDSIQPSKSLPDPLIQNLEIDYAFALYKMDEERQIDVNPGEKVVNVYFASLDLGRAEEITYEYRIAGVNEDWVTAASSTRLATYTTLPIGEHVFEVRAKGPYGMISNTSTLTILVHAPFWKTGWFRLLVAVFVLSVTWLSIRAYYRGRLNRKLRALEVQQKIQAERERISRDLHDNVGTQITHVISSLDNLAYANRGANGLGEKLEDLSDFTRSTMSFLRETIWVINQDEVGLKELAEKVDDYGRRIAQNSTFKFELKFEEADTKPLSPALAMNAFRIMQEALTNAVKHSEGSKLLVEIEAGTDQVKISIADNGKGFDGKGKDGHYGLDNMNSRVAEMQGSLKIDSADSGTRVSFNFPITTTANA